MSGASGQEEELFETARKLTDPAERAAYLEAACVGNPTLRQQLEALLVGYVRSDEFFAYGAKAVDPSRILLPDAEKPGDRIGRYKLLQQIGEGGCGVVYMAEQEVPVHRRVALKVIKLGMDTKSVVARFEAERQVLALMDHPHIAKVFDAGATETGRPYFVMELVCGLKLTDYCDQNQLSTIVRLELFVRVCHAVQHAHQKGIIHRDLKPSNILVTVNDGVAVPKVIDFGIAKAVQGRLSDQTLFTAFEQFLGTPAYMSPEQATMSSLDVDTRSDIYSLGVLLYELLTGTTPFETTELLAAGLDEMRRAIREKEPPRPSTCVASHLAAGHVRLESASQKGAGPEGEPGAFLRRRPQESNLINLLSGDLDWIVMKCLEKERTRRYETANGLAMDIARYLHDEPVLARPPSLLYRFQKFARRNQLAVVAGLAIILSLLLGISATIWQSVQATHAKQVAVNAQASETSLRRKAEADFYTSDINVALQAWQKGDLKTAQELLRGHIPKGKEPDLRGFEWRYLWNLCQDESLHTIHFDTTDPVQMLVTTPNHGFIVVCRADSIRLLDPVSGVELPSLWSSVPQTIKKIRSVPAGQSVSPTLVALAPGATNLFAVKRADGVVELWDLASRTRRVGFTPSVNGVGTLALSADGRFLATGEHPDHGSRVLMWRISPQPNQPPSLVWSNQTDVCPTILRFSPDGQTIVANSKTFIHGNIGVWNVTSGTELQPEFPKKSIGYLLDLAFSPNGQRLASVGVQSAIKVWNFSDRTVHCSLEGHLAHVNSLAFSGDGSRLISGGDDGTIRFWDVIEGKPLEMLRDPYDREVRSVVFAPNGKRIFSTTANELKIWNTNSRPPAAVIQTHQEVGAPAISPDNKWLVTRQATVWSKDYASAESVKVWDPASAKQQFSLVSSNVQPLAPVFSPDGKFFVLGGEGPNLGISIWETASWEWAQGSLAPNHWFTNDFEAGSICFSPDSKIMAVAGLAMHPQIPSGATNRLAFFEVGSWRKLSLLTEAGLGPTPEAAAGTAAFSPDGRLLAVGHRDGWVRLWDFQQKRLIRKWKVSGDFHPYSAAVSFSPNGRWLASFSLGATPFVLHDLQNPQKDPLTIPKAHPSSLWSASFDPDNRSLVTSGNDGLIKFWNLETAKVALTLEHSHGPHVRIAFSEDGNLLVSMDSLGTAKLWRAAKASDRP
jgi:WD40 repeat protein/serine/threonine protein kinase